MATIATGSMVHAAAAIGWWERVRSAVERVTKIYIKGELLNNFCHFVHLSWALDLKEKKKKKKNRLELILKNDWTTLRCWAIKEESPS